jgi:hypothetical protein
MTYEAQVRLDIVPNLGDVPLTHFARAASERLEGLYGRLRRCRSLCSGRPFVERHVSPRSRPAGRPAKPSRKIDLPLRRARTTSSTREDSPASRLKS